MIVTMEPGAHSGESAHKHDVSEEQETNNPGAQFERCAGSDERVTEVVGRELASG